MPERQQKMSDNSGIGKRILGALGEWYSSYFTSAGRKARFEKKVANSEMYTRLSIENTLLHKRAAKLASDNAVLDEEVTSLADANQALERESDNAKARARGLEARLESAEAESARNRKIRERAVSTAIRRGRERKVLRESLEKSAGEKDGLFKQLHFAQVTNDKVRENARQALLTAAHHEAQTEALGSVIEYVKKPALILDRNFRIAGASPAMLGILGMKHAEELYEKVPEGLAAMIQRDGLRIGPVLGEMIGNPDVAQRLYEVADYFFPMSRNDWHFTVGMVVGPKGRKYVANLRIKKTPVAASKKQKWVYGGAFAVLERPRSSMARAVAGLFVNEQAYRMLSGHVTSEETGALIRKALVPYLDISGKRITDDLGPIGYHVVADLTNVETIESGAVKQIVSLWTFMDGKIRDLEEQGVQMQRHYVIVPRRLREQFMEANLQRRAMMLPEKKEALKPAYGELDLGLAPSS